MKLRTKLTLFNTISKLVIVTIFVLLLPVLIKSISQRYTDARLLKQKNKMLEIINNQDVPKYRLHDITGDDPANHPSRSALFQLHTETAGANHQDKIDRAQIPKFRVV